MKKLYIIAALFALITAVVVYQFAMYLEEISVAEAVPQSDVVVAAADIPQYTIIAAEMLTVKTMPTVAVMPNAVFTADELIGRVATAPFVSGEQILISQTAAEGDTDLHRLSAELKSGMTAYVLNVSVSSGAAGYIQKGDRISLASVRDVAGTDGRLSSEIEIFMRNIEVLRVNTSAAENSLDYSTLTLEVSDAEALLLTYYDSIGSIKAFLTSLFTESDGTRVIDRSDESDTLDETALSVITLGGIFFSENASSQAVISTAAETLILKVGDSIAETGWYVSEIGAGSVIIKKNGKTETLYPKTAAVSGV